MPKTPIQARLRAALTAALSSRDAVAVGALRSALSAITNAEAITPAQAARTRPSSEHIAGAVAGLGAAEAARRELTETDVTAIITAEITDRLSAANDYDRLDRPEQSARLRREANVLSDLLTVRE
jgi:hypothetical protein